MVLAGGARHVEVTLLGIRIGAFRARRALRPVAAGSTGSTGPGTLRAACAGSARGAISLAGTAHSFAQPIAHAVAKCLQFSFGQAATLVFVHESEALGGAFLGALDLGGDEFLLGDEPVLVGVHLGEAGGSKSVASAESAGTGAVGTGAVWTGAALGRAAGALSAGRIGVGPGGVGLVGFPGLGLGIRSGRFVGRRLFWLFLFGFFGLVGRDGEAEGRTEGDRGRQEIEDWFFHNLRLKGFLCGG